MSRQLSFQWHFSITLHDSLRMGVGGGKIKKLNQRSIRGGYGAQPPPPLYQKSFGFQDFFWPQTVAEPHPKKNKKY